MGGYVCVTVSVACLLRVLFGRDGRLEFEDDALAVADLPEVGVLVVWDDVGTEVKGCQCPVILDTIRKGDNTYRKSNQHLDILVRSLTTQITVPVAPVITRPARL